MTSSGPSSTASGSSTGTSETAGTSLLIISSSIFSFGADTDSFSDSCGFSTTAAGSDVFFSK